MRIPKGTCAPCVPVAGSNETAGQWRQWIICQKCTTFFNSSMQTIRLFDKLFGNLFLRQKQVKPGFTNYPPRGLAPKIESFNQKFWKLKKHLQNYSKMSKISEKCGEILTVEKNFKKILNCKKFK